MSAASPLLRDLELLDAALLATVRGVLTRELAVAGPEERALVRLGAERLLAAAVTLQGLVARRALDDAASLAEAA